MPRRVFVGSEMEAIACARRSSSRSITQSARFGDSGTGIWSNGNEEVLLKLCSTEVTTVVVFEADGGILGDLLVTWGEICFILTFCLLSEIRSGSEAWMMGTT